MNPEPVIARRRVFTDTECRHLADTADTASNTSELLARLVSAVYTILLADDGHVFGDAAAPPVHPDLYAVPAAQWNAISAYAINLAKQWGTAAHVALELINLAPATYDDPHVQVPQLPMPDLRPTVHQVHIDRAASEVIAANEQLLQHLQAAYGATSAQYRDAADSWRRGLAQLLASGLGTPATVHADGQHSLHVRTPSLQYALIWHRHHRRCTACGVALRDDGTNSAANRTTADGSGCQPHQPSYPSSAPAPGTWTFHS